MAGNDGNIPLKLSAEVSLDTTSVARSANEYSDHFQNAFNKALTKLNLSKSQIIPMRKVANELYKTMESVGKGARFSELGGGLGAQISDMSLKISTLGRQIDKALGKGAKGNEVKIDTNVAEKKMEEMLKLIVEYNKAVSEMKPLVAEASATQATPMPKGVGSITLEESMRARGRAARANNWGMPQTPAAESQITKQADAVTDASEKATQALENLGETATNVFTANAIPTGTWQTPLNELPKVALNAITGFASGFKEGFSDAFSEVSPILHERFVQPVTDRIKNARDTIVAGATGFASGLRDGIKEGLDETGVTERVNAIKARFSELKESIQDSDFYQFHAERARMSLSAIGGVVDNIKYKFRELGDSAFVENLTTGLQSIPSKVGGALSSIPSKIKGIFTNSFAGVIPNMEAMANSVGKVTSKLQQLASVALGGVKKGLGALIGKFRQMSTAAGKSADNVSKKMKRMTIQMIKAGLGVRGLYMLFRKLRQAIKEGMDTLAQNVPEFNKVFSDFKTALNGIKGSVGTAFQPILQVVLPILTQLANALSNVLVMIAKFNAVLTGQGYIYKFTAAQQDYAKSLKGTGGAAKKATRDLMGFDEINRLSAPNEGGGGGSSGIGDYEKEMVDRASAISEFAEMVKAAWEKADFTEVGKKIGESIKSGLEQATDFFDTTGQKWAKHLSSSLSTFINGLVDVQGLGYSLGEAIGSGINVGITFLRDFWRDTNFTGIGEQIAGAINGMFDKVDWDGLGEYFGYKFNGIFDTIGGIADVTNWDNIGISLATSLNSMIQTMDLGEAVSNVSSLIVGMFQSGISFLTTTDFTAIGEELADGLAGIDWSGVLGNAGTLISKGAQGICDMVIGFVKKTDWAKTTKDILDGLKKMFENVWDDGELINKLAEGFGALLGAALEAFFNIGGWVYDNIVVPLGTALSEEFTFDPDSPWYEVGWNIIQGILKGIWDALIGIGEWIADNIVQPMIDGICEAFGIHSPSTVMMEIGGDLIEGLFEGLSGIWDAICDIFETLKENILGVFSDIASGISGIWDDIKSGVSTAWNAIKTTVVNIVSGIMRTVTNQFKNLQEGVLSIFRFIRDVAGAIWDGLCTVFTTVFETVWETLQKIFGKIAEFLQWIIDKIQEIKEWLGLEGAMTAKVQTMKMSVSGAGAGVNIEIPHLATGAVLPPNQPFLSIVGDQSRGTNVEAPLDTIKQAVAEVMNENLEGMMAGFEAVVNAINNKDTTAVISYRAVGEANRKYNREMETIRGY